MNKEQKAQAVDEIAQRLSEAGAIFAIDYRGISVPEAAELRARLREADATFKVVKNRLAKRAAAKAGKEGLDALFEGPTALTFVKGDAVAAAKAISAFARQNELLTYKGGFMEGAPLDPEGFRAIARLPGRDVLQGQLVGLAASPLTGLLGGLANLISGLARQLSQVHERGLVGGTAEAAPEAGEEPAEADDEPEAEADDEPEAEGEEPDLQAG